MPLLVAPDEYDSAITRIVIHAELCLADPSYQEAALRLILALSQQTDKLVEDVLAEVYV